MSDTALEITASLTWKDLYFASMSLISKQAGTMLFPLMYTAGGILVALGILGLLLHVSLWYFWILFLLIGFYFLIYPKVLLPFFVRRRVKNEFKSNPCMQNRFRIIVTDTAVLEEPILGQEPPYIELNYPFEVIRMAVQTPTHIIIQYDTAVSSVVNKKMLSEQQLVQLTSLLSAKLGGRYVECTA